MGIYGDLFHVRKLLALSWRVPGVSVEEPTLHCTVVVVGPVVNIPGFLGLKYHPFGGPGCLNHPQ